MAKPRLPLFHNIDRHALSKLEQLPNIGPAAARYLRRMGISRPEDLVGRDPYALYEDLCRRTGRRYDPCLLDQMISTVRFMAGEAARPWWEYSAERKRELAKRKVEARDE